MATLRRFLARLWALVQFTRADNELNREIRSHLQLLEDEFVASGMNADDARAAARRAFGGVEQTKEHQRETRSFAWVSGWSMDLKLGARMLRKSPGLTTIGVIALTVAIGAGAAYLEFVNDFFRPRLSFPEGDRFVGLVHIDPASGGAQHRALHQFAQWAPRLTTVTHLGIAQALEQNLVGANGMPEPVRGAAVSASIHNAIPVAPLAGRLLTVDDERPGAPPVALLGEDLWRARFGADPTTVGRSVLLGHTPTTIVGIMPASFGFPVNNNLWIPFRLRPETFANGEGPSIHIVGQLARGVSLADADAELATIARAVSVDPSRPTTATVKPYVESVWTASNLVTQVRLLYGLNLVFAALLALCATNVATLVFARTATREGEITVRTALGASRARIVSQLVAEALVLTTIAAVTGLTGATILLRTVRRIWTAAQGSPMPFWWNEQLGAETMLYALVLVVVASLIVGGIPAWKATGPQMQRRLKDAGAAGATVRFGRWWTGVIVSQAAVTVVFLSTVVVLALEGRSMGRTFEALAYPHNEYVTAFVEFDDQTPAEQKRRTLTELQHHLLTTPGVRGATYVNRLWNAEEFWLEFAQPDVASSARPPGDVLWVRSARIAEHYFETFGQSLVAGRMLTSGEIASGAAVAVVDESFVRLVLGGRNPIGLQVRQPATEQSSSPGPWHDIVGVVTDLAPSSSRTTEDASLYRPLVLGASDLTRLVMRSPAPDAIARLRAAASATDPDMRLAEVMTMDRVIDAEVQTFQFFTVAMSAIAAVALLLSTAGIYALVSFTLSRRVRDIGIRTALGAAPRQVVTGTLSRVFRQVAAGVVIGSIPGSALLLTMGADAAATHGSTMPLLAVGAVAMFFVLVAALSCIPLIHRALRINPTDALRSS